mgnify:CR=1 FL=1
MSEKSLQIGLFYGSTTCYTEMAAEKINKALTEQEMAGKSLRLGVFPGGCGGGYQYALGFDDQKDNDTTFEASFNALYEGNCSNPILIAEDELPLVATAKELNIENAKGSLLPEDKLNEVEILKKNPENKIAFIGDGINDAPVLAASNVGIAMGGLGSDVAIETADVIIQTDQPSKVVRAIKISRSTRKIVWQNIILAFGVKVIVLILGAGGLATMWEAVFADVGVALLAILNAVRLQRMSWD